MTNYYNLIDICLVQKPEYCSLIIFFDLFIVLIQYFQTYTTGTIIQFNISLDLT